MKHILVPYDGSTQAEKAFDLALDFATKYQAGITVLAIARLPEPHEDEETEAELDAAQKHYNELFKKLTIKSQSLSVSNLNFEVKVGHPAEQIIYYAENNYIDHIVMGHRGNTFFHRLLLGSVAKQVMIYAHCAITVVR
jgi:nucleotide-binding universal stress UspA family protein